MENKPNQPVIMGDPAGPRKKSPLYLIVLLGVVFVLVVMAAVLVSGLIPNGGKPPAGNGDNLPRNSMVKKFQSYDEMKEFISENSSNGMYGYFASSVMLDSARSKAIENTPSWDESEGKIQTWGAAEKPVGAPGAYENPISSGDYSTTNIQVAGVDEGDMVKTDGKYIYIGSGGSVQIAEAYPASDANVVSTIKLDSSIGGIYVNGDKLVVYGYDYNLYGKDAYKDLKPVHKSSGYAFLKVYDISDKKDPKMERDLNFEGNYSNSRMIGDYVYFLTSYYNRYGVYDDKEPLPLVIEDGKILSNDRKEAKCNCPDVYYFDIPYNSYVFTTISAVNIADSGKNVSSDVYLLDGSQNGVYVSEKNIYVTYNKNVNPEILMWDVVKDMFMPKMSAKDKERIAEIEKTKNYILSPEEKLAKIMLIMQKYAENLSEEEQKAMQKEMEAKIKQKYADISKELEKTVIHKISVSGDKIAYKAFGEVTGYVLNQYSMDESNGHFFIATTKNRTWSQFADEEEQQSYSNIYALDSDMKVVGKIEKLAEGESIYSVRFMQGRAYMVTFRRTDPLFVIDLKDPSDLKLMGQLKVPGYSSYLHPYDDVTLIGLGKESDENGRIIGGVKISLFDVSEVSNPKEIDKYVLGDSSSDSRAINDPKAFLFSRDKNLLVIPVTARNTAPFLDKDGIAFEENEMLRKPMPPAYPKYFNGAYIFNVDLKNGIVFKGAIDHNSIKDDVSSMHVKGEKDNALQFNGQDQYARVLNIEGLKGSKEATFSYWVKYDKLSGYRLSGYLKNQGGESIRLGSLDGKKIYFDAGVHKDASADYTFETGKWYNLALTMKAGDKWKVYVNGKLVTEGTQGLVSGEFGSIPFFGLGGSLEYSQSSPSYVLDGTMDDARIYKRALSEKEVLFLYQKEDVSEEGLVGWWKFDEAAGSQLKDSSKQGKDAAIESRSEYYSYYNNNFQIHRSLYIKDILYTLSAKYLKANNLSDLSEIKTLDLGGKSEPMPMRGGWAE